MLYQYIACSETGEIVRGKISGNSEDAIGEMMGYAGFRLINLKPYVPFFSLGKLSAQFFPVKTPEIIMLFRQLALLLESGINILTALELLREQMSNRTLKKVVGEVIEDVRSGNQLSTAMSRHPVIFPAMAVRSLGIGEQTGGMETMLRQVAEYMEREVMTQKGIKGALMYPMIAGIVAVVVVAVLMIVVLPAFAGLYDDLGAELPAITKLMMDVSGFLQEYIMQIVLGLLITVALAVLYVKTPDGKYKLDKLLLRIPLLGRIRLLNELSRACRSISLLYSAGLPLTEIMPMVVQGSGNRVMAEALYNVQTEMLKGEGLSSPMSKNPLFLPMMVQMVKVGEETGSLDNSILAVAQNYEAEAQDKTKTLIGIIPPVMTVIIAGMVGLIAVSMVSAMYGMYGQNI
ncbi:MAG: type II secretion system F family protein [Dehalococcoidales bacterium]|nr:type II secretion system F family protein [Dehalococcoidales bacterium]